MEKNITKLLDNVDALLMDVFTLLGGDLDNSGNPIGGQDALLVDTIRGQLIIISNNNT